MMKNAKKEPEAPKQDDTPTVGSRDALDDEGLHEPSSQDFSFENSVVVLRKRCGQNRGQRDAANLSKARSVVIDRIFKCFRHRGETSTSLAKKDPESKGALGDAAKGPGNETPREGATIANRVFDDIGFSLSRVLDIPVPISPSGSPGSAECGVVDVPRKLTAIPPSSIIRPVPVPAKRVRIASNQIQKLEGSDMHELRPVRLQRFVEELGNSEQAHLSKICDISVNCNREHASTSCGRENGGQEGPTIRRSDMDNACNTTISDDDRTLNAHLVTDFGVRKAGSYTLLRPQDVPNIPLQDMGTRVIRLRDEFDESLLCITSGTSPQYNKSSSSR